MLYKNHYDYRYREGVARYLEKIIANAIQGFVNNIFICLFVCLSVLPLKLIFLTWRCRHCRWRTVPSVFEQGANASPARTRGLGLSKGPQNKYSNMSQHVWHDKDPSLPRIVAKHSDKITHFGKKSKCVRTKSTQFESIFPSALKVHIDINLRYGLLTHFEKKAT